MINNDSLGKVEGTRMGRLGLKIRGFDSRLRKRLKNITVNRWSTLKKLGIA